MAERNKMKPSKYTIEIPISENIGMLYNTLSRKYYVYSDEERKAVLDLLKDVNKGVYSKKELSIFREFVLNGIIVQDSVDENRKLEYLENAARFQEQTYKMVIYATNACNFRCSYCTQNHEVHPLTESTMNKILRHIEKMSKRVRRIEVDWFGGEPLLEYSKIEYLMKQAIKICADNGCEIKGTITTNGYLLTEEMLKEMVQLQIQAMQITVDGKKDIHDKRRILANGEGTFEKIISNINLALKMGIRITLRINIDEQNKEDISEVLEKILPEYRKLLYVSICNVFQNKEIYSTFSLLKYAMEHGFRAHDRWNHYSHCHACLKNAIIVDSDGNLLLCSNANEENRMGYINADGNICMERRADYWRLKTVTARDNPECQNCIELPYCIAACKYQRMQDNEKCTGKQGDGLTLTERAMLDYYYDIQQEKWKENHSNE